MGGTLREQILGPMRWLTASGEASDCFRALGGHMRTEIREAVTEWTSTQRLREHVSASPGREQLAAVRSATQAGFAAEWAELAALADGAGVPTEDLALLNFRGDLGQVEGGFNCSDLAWRRERSFIAHNEDQGASMTGRCVLLTLAIDGLPPVFAFWCPMFLPSNAFWGNQWAGSRASTSLTVPEPGASAGRHFIARGLQRRCQHHRRGHRLLAVPSVRLGVRLHHRRPPSRRQQSRGRNRDWADGGVERSLVMVTT